MRMGLESFSARAILRETRPRFEAAYLRGKAANWPGQAETGP